MRATISLRRFVLPLSFLGLTPSASQGQVAYDSPKGRVEVLGLRRWTLSMLQDSIRRYVPGQELHDAACMVTLRDSLHFADASVVSFEMQQPDGKTRSLLSIKVVEPNEASTVQWDVHRRNVFTSLLPDYAPVVLPITGVNGEFYSGRIMNWLQHRDSASRQRAIARAPASARADAERLYAFLDGRAAEPDRARAMATLARDGLWVNRLIAAAVLANFPANDSTWLTLVRALRDPAEGVRMAAEDGLRRMPQRSIDWRPVTGDLRLLMGGTNLPAIETVFALLARTEIQPDLAAPLLRGNGQWILDHLGSEMPMAPQAAHRLLVRLNNGRDLGATRDAWATWVNAH